MNESMKAMNSFLMFPFSTLPESGYVTISESEPILLGFLQGANDLAVPLLESFAFEGGREEGREEEKAEQRRQRAGRGGKRNKE